MSFIGHKKAIYVWTKCYNPCRIFCIKWFFYFFHFTFLLTKMCFAPCLHHVHLATRKHPGGVLSRQDASCLRLAAVCGCLRPFKLTMPWVLPLPACAVSPFHALKKNAKKGRKNLYNAPFYTLKGKAPLSAAGLKGIAGARFLRGLFPGMGRRGDCGGVRARTVPKTGGSTSGFWNSPWRKRGFPLCLKQKNRNGRDCAWNRELGNPEGKSSDSQKGSEKSRLLKRRKSDAL